MNVDRGAITHNALDGHQILVHPIEIALLVPNITVHLLFKITKIFEIQFLFSLGNRLCNFRITTHINLFCIVSTACKRRINID